MGIGRDLVIDDVRGILTEAAHQTQRDVDSRMEELQCPLLSIRLFFHDELKAACISQSVPWSDTSGQSGQIQIPIHEGSLDCLQVFL